MEIIGKPTINKLLFTIGKLSIGGNIVFVFLKKWIEVYNFSFKIKLFAFIILGLPGLLIFIISLINLGKSLRVGLPNDNTQLKTKGLYALSRNPIYLSVFMIGAFSCIFVPHWLNILFFLIVVTIHHKIILGEEQFLKERFGQQWIDYTKKARRYI